MAPKHRLSHSSWTGTVNSFFLNWPHFCLIGIRLDVPQKSGNKIISGEFVEKYFGQGAEW